MQQTQIIDSNLNIDEVSDKQASRHAVQASSTLLHGKCLID